jgi:hypothetical protein
MASCLNGKLTKHQFVKMASCLNGKLPLNSKLTGIELPKWQVGQKLCCQNGELSKQQVA